MILPERFWDRVEIGPSCWEWTGTQRPDGRGTFRHDGTMRLAHRLAYEHVVGVVPSGLELDHLCRVPLCVNPDHLEPVTHRENVLRGSSPAARQAMQTSCLRGHQLSAANTYVQIRRGLPMRSCKICRRAAVRRCREGQR